MGFLTNQHRRRLRIRIRNAIMRFPGTTKEKAEWMADVVLDEVHVEPLAFAEECPVPECACWGCVLLLHASVTQERNRMLVAAEAAEDHD